jgi:hypothetical protein
VIEANPVVARYASLVRDHEARLVEALCTQMRCSTASHYRDSAPALLRVRCQAVVEAMRRSLELGPACFIEHVRQVALRRQAEGFRLSEVQLVLAALEEQLWLLARQLPTDVEGLLAVLARVSGTVGAAKDAMARVFLDQLRDREAQLGQIAEQGLFEGTDSGASVDGDAEGAAPLTPRP